MKTVYLVGQISPKFVETYEWRNRVINNMRPYNEGGQDRFKFINPCANGFNKDILRKGKYAIEGKNHEFGMEVLPHKDLSFVMESDIAIANLNQYDPDKPLLGTFFELAWYSLHHEKTVIGFADNLTSYICKHPFVSQAVNVWVKDEIEACYVLERYFIDM